MDVQRAKQTLRKHFGLAWSSLTSSVGQIATGCDVKPTAYSEVFDIDEDDDRSMKVVVKPVAFLLKETARAPRAEMFVVVSGKVNFAITGEMETPLAHYFAATVGYFRKRGQVLDHVLGVHYDHDDRRPVHPVYHAQLKSCAGLLSTINEHYRPTFALGRDLMVNVPDKVRLPTAHMDPLAVFVQLLADHLLNENSGPAVASAFERTRSTLMFFNSDPDRARRLDEVTGNRCFRGPRWYPEPRPIAPRPEVVLTAAAEIVAVPGGTKAKSASGAPSAAE